MLLSRQLEKTIHPIYPYTFRFPSNTLLSTLIDLYFTRQNVYLPLLHRPTFERGVAEGLHLRFVGVSFMVRRSIDDEESAGMTALLGRSCSSAPLAPDGARTPARLAVVLNVVGSGLIRYRSRGIACSGPRHSPSCNTTAYAFLSFFFLFC
jgi:hypothetical protein